MYPAGNSFWVCRGSDIEPVFLEDAGHGQQPQRDTALRYVNKFDHCLDIGSNVGQWTRPLKQRFKKVDCFEPNPMFRECFTRNIPLDNVQLHPYGLSDRPHTASQVFNQTVLKDDPGDIECRTLDSYNFTDIDFIKIDVDGFEIPLLEGARKTLQTNSAVINIEMKTDKRPSIVARAVTILQSVGYRRVSRVKSDEVWLKS
jgi:FkbM family methyltransferase